MKSSFISAENERAGLGDACVSGTRCDAPVKTIVYGLGLVFCLRV